MTPHFWPTLGEWGAVSVGALVGVAGALVTNRLLRPQSLSLAAVGRDAALNLWEWEKDRLQNATKGVAASSAAFALALITSILKGEVSEEVATFVVLGSLAGALGALLLAARLSARSAVLIAAMAASLPPVPP